MKQLLFEIFENRYKNPIICKIVNNLIFSLILLTIVSIVLESFESLAVKFRTWFRLCEILSITIFSIEYVIRVWIADLKYPNKNRFVARISYIFSFMALIDLLAILPFYLPMIIPFDLRFLRILRLTRLFRIMKLNRYSSALQLIGKVINEKKEELVATISIMVFIILISSTLIYYFETDVQPDAFPNIVASFWWAVATLTTVGYGDIYPITVMGKILSSIIAITGIGLVALPTGILSSGFMDGLKKEKEIVCPKCGERFKN